MEDTKLVEAQEELDDNKAVATGKKKRQPKEGESRAYGYLFGVGFEDGYKQAGTDYVNNEVMDFDLLDTERNFRDGYEMGHEVGYLRKLAELLVY